MSVEINIQGTLIDFPSSGQSPNWAPAIIEFAQAVETTLIGVVGPYDVSPQVIDILNVPSQQDILALSFASTVVRSAEIKYSVYRKNDDPYVEAETGTLSVVFTGSTWYIQREFMSNQTLLANPADQKKLLDMLREASNSLTRIESERTLISEAIKNVAEKYEIPKKTFRRMAKVYHKQNFNEEQETHQEFELLYETVMTTGAPDA